MSHKDSMCSLTALIEQSVLRKTDCLGETRLVPHLPYHELESEIIVIVIITE